jgi:hypothetical protein
MTQNGSQQSVCCYAGRQLIFQLFQQLSSFVRAGHLLFGFLFLTSSSKLFWAAVPGWTNFFSSTAASPERCTLHFWTPYEIKIVSLIGNL